MNFVALSGKVSSNGLTAGVLMRVAFDSERADGKNVYEAARQAALVAFGCVQELLAGTVTVNQESAIAAQDAALMYLRLSAGYEPRYGSVVADAVHIRDEVLGNASFAAAAVLKAQETSSDKLKQAAGFAKQALAQKGLTGRYPIPVSAIIQSTNLTLSGLGANEESLSDYFLQLGKDTLKDVVGAGGELLKEKLSPKQQAKAQDDALAKLKEQIAAQTGTPAAQVTSAQVDNYLKQPGGADQFQQLLATMLQAQQPKPMSTTTMALIGGGAAAFLLLIAVIALKK
jgi:hypothetical protein